MAWLTKIPIGIVRAHLVMMPRLEAREARTSAIASALAHRLEPSDQQWKAWDQKANEGRPRMKATERSLRSVGIGIRKAARRG